MGTCFCKYIVPSRHMVDSRNIDEMQRLLHRYTRSGPSDMGFLLKIWSHGMCLQLLGINHQFLYSIYGSNLIHIQENNEGSNGYENGFTWTGISYTSLTSMSARIRVSPHYRRVSILLKKTNINYRKLKTCFGRSVE